MTNDSEFARVFITGELAGRDDKVPDYKHEKDSLRTLVGQMVAEPGQAIPEFVRLATELTQSSSAGLSLLEADESEGEVFRWHHLHGELARFEGATTPRNHSPCGHTLDRRAPVLCRRPERAYPWISEAGISLAEVLLVPIYVGGHEPFGTLWMTSHDDGHFRLNDVRVASELADLIGMGLRLQQTERERQRALEQQELLAREMSHRVKNVFALIDGMIHLSALDGGSGKDLAKSLSQRLHALAKAHALVRRDAASSPATADLATLIEAVVGPYDFVSDRRFTIEGPGVTCGTQSANGLALVFHELATNAAKYGSLSHNSGRVSINWTVANGELRIVWEEDGGSVPAAPSQTGFGTKLVDMTVAGQFAGTVEYLWCETGLVCTMWLNASKLAQ